MSRGRALVTTRAKRKAARSCRYLSVCPGSEKAVADLEVEMKASTRQVIAVITAVSGAPISLVHFELNDLY